MTHLERARKCIAEGEVWPIKHHVPWQALESGERLIVSCDTNYLRSWQRKAKVQSANCVKLGKNYRYDANIDEKGLVYVEKLPKPMTRFELLERVNVLNMRNQSEKYWTCYVLYNTVIWRKCEGCEAEIFEVIEGFPK